jgi:hypothetical protein
MTQRKFCLKSRPKILAPRLLFLTGIRRAGLIAGLLSVSIAFLILATRVLPLQAGEQEAPRSSYFSLSGSDLSAIEFCDLDAKEPDFDDAVHVVRLLKLREISPADFLSAPSSAAVTAAAQISPRTTVLII